jgi:anti-sigma factor RsiW
MPCDRDRSVLATYLDGELSSEKHAEMQQHLSGCASCAAEVASLVSVRRSLAAARGRFTPTDEFRRKIQRQIAPERRPSVLLRWMPIAISVAAMLLLTIGALRYSYRSDTFSEVADLHINALASANPVDVVSTDRHTVKPWFQGRIPFSFNVPEMGGSEFALIGGRVNYLRQRPGAQLLVDMHQHRISVLIFQESVLDREIPSAAGVSNHNHFSTVTWRSNGLRFFVIGDAEPAEIDKLAELFRRANS